MAGGQGIFKDTNVSSLEALTQLITKESYSLGTFEGNKRKNEHFKSAEWIGLDFDNGLSLSEAQEFFKDYTHIIGTTRNHLKDKNGIIAERFRVLLKLSEPITDEKDYKATVIKLMNEYPDADRSCSDSARYFYPCDKIISYGKGKTIDPVEYVKREIKPVDVTVKGQLSRKTLEFITFAPLSSSGEGVSNGRLFNAAIDCMEQGYTKEECIELLSPAILRRGDLNDDILKQIDSGYNKEVFLEKRLADTPFSFNHPLEVKSNQADVKWIVDGLLAEGSLSIFAGPSKSGKSTLTRQLAVATARGGSFLDRKCQKSPVIYLAIEEEANMIKAQFKHIGVESSDKIYLHVGDLGSGDRLKALEDSIIETEAKLVVIDILLLFAGFEDPNNYNEVYKKVTDIKNIARRTGAHIVGLHHTNKGEDQGANSIMGSTALQGAADASIVLRNIRGREFYRTITSWQRGGQRFLSQQIKYLNELDQYEISTDSKPDF